MSDPSDCVACGAFPTTLEALVGWSHFHADSPACWWFVREVYRRHLGVVLPYENVLLPRPAWGRLIDAEAGEWLAMDVPRPYDVVLIQRHRAIRVDHLGLYAGAGQVLHVPTTRAGVCLNALSYFTTHDCVTRVYRRA